MLVHDQQPAVTPNVAAGLFLAARSLSSALAPDLPMPGASQIVAATGATRSRAYELCQLLLSLLPTLSRPPGRPPRREPAPEGVVAELRGELLRFIMQHPGCVHVSPKRLRYAECFRCFVLELRQRHAEQSLRDFAEALCIPPGTIEDWLRPGRLEVTTEPPSEAASDRRPTTTEQPELDEPDVESIQIQTVLSAWSTWHGDFGSFCEHVRTEHRLPFGKTLIAQILFTHGERIPKRRPGRSRDEQAVRGTFETFFPGAQWVGDGKQLEVVVDGEVFHPNLELVVDACSGAAVGIDVRDAEDGPAVIAALEHGVETTGERPLALLLDNKPSNHTDEVDAALGETMRLRSTPGRAQNKAHVEGAFGLFAQTVPPIELRTHDPAQLARTVAWLMALTFFRVLNRRPRRDRDGLSRIELYEQHVTPQQREAARAALQERLRKQRLAQETRTARLDPVTRKLLDDAFARLELLDPERHFRDAIACYPLDAIVDAIAIFDGKRTAGTLPEGVDARYLLGIVRNLHHCHEAEPITAALVRERLAARDLLLQPLLHEHDAILARAAGEPGLALDAIVDQLTKAERAIDRSFWLDAAVALFPRDDQQRVSLSRRAARRIHAAFRVPPRQRSELTRSLLRRLWPLD